MIILRTHCFFEIKGLDFMLFYADSLIIRFFFVYLQPKPNKDWLWQDRLKKHRYWRVKMQSVSAGTWTTLHQYQKRRRKGRDRHTKCLSIIHQTVLCSDESLQYIHSGTDIRDWSYCVQVCWRRLERFFVGWIERLSDRIPCSYLSPREFGAYTIPLPLTDERDVLAIWCQMFHFHVIVQYKSTLSIKTGWGNKMLTSIQDFFHEYV